MRNLLILQERTWQNWCSGVLVTINRNKQIMEPFTFLVNEALRNVSQGVSTSNDARVEEELPNTHDDLLDNDSDICYSQDIYNVPISQSIFISDYELNTNVQSLKKK